MTPFDELKKSIAPKLESAQNVHDVDALWRAYLGRKGSVSAQVKALKNVSPAVRAQKGKQLNQLKEELDTMFKSRLAELEARAQGEGKKKNAFDVTRPATREPEGSLHPLTHLLDEAETIFGSMGFEVIEGPQIETEWYNFDALNVPPGHPARDLQDTFWLRRPLKAKSESRPSTGVEAAGLEEEKLLLRTHTSPMQIRYMQEHHPPFRIIVPGRVFRYEATDASHHFQFYQIEGLMVAESISVANFKAVIEEFYRGIFQKNVKTRLRPSYFPFVEPGFEVDMSCITCDGKGCSVCSQTGWLEMMGAGMVHPKVFEAAGYNPKNWTGFASTQLIIVESV